MNEIQTTATGMPRCAARETDLLMLLHGDLPLLQKLQTRWHLRTCPDCRRQMILLAAASYGFADVLRGSELPPWGPPGGLPVPVPAGRGTVFFRAPVFLGAVAVVLFVIGATVYVKHSAAAHNEPPLPELTAPGSGDISCAADAIPIGASPHGHATPKISAPKVPK